MKVLECIFHSLRDEWRVSECGQSWDIDVTKEEILDNHRSVLCSFGTSTKDE